jgi:hypothetical protein
MPVWEVECYRCSTIVGRYKELPDACDASRSHYKMRHEESQMLTTFVLRGLTDSTAMNVIPARRATEEAPPPSAGMALSRVLSALYSLTESSGYRTWPRTPPWSWRTRRAAGPGG